jgi:Trk-type K+ transport system membrane component
LDYIRRLSLIFAGLSISFAILDLGFDHPAYVDRLLHYFYLTTLLTGIASIATKYVGRALWPSRKVWIFDLLMVMLILWLFAGLAFSGNPEKFHIPGHPDYWITFLILALLIRELSLVRWQIRRTSINPAQLFIGSFLLLIVMGALLLMLPRATYEGISFLDALFTSTSAVCVTGLIVVDTATYFTPFGQGIILLLIQIGGLGILTFASYFSFFFRGISSFENQLTISDILSAEKVGEVFSVLRYILVITFSIEAISAALIFFSVDTAAFTSWYDKLFFSVFHSVSAFCNAGFSTLTNGLYDEGLRFNYFLQFVIILTFGLGGLGFPIVANLASFVWYNFLRLVASEPKNKRYRPWLLNLNSRITLITTLSLTIVGTIFMYLVEYHNTLADHRGIGKVVVALFEAATPRTAGFNNIDLTELRVPALLMTFFLMWIGASPVSTGGGIKTSTFAIALLNVVSVARGMPRMEVFRRQISENTVRRAFAVIALSLLVIGTGITLLTIFEGDKSLMGLAFECFSAYSTVGLSLGMTGSLSEPGKVVVIVLMFVGRVSMLSLLIAFFRKARFKSYRYPTEEITIN